MKSVGLVMITVVIIFSGCNKENEAAVPTCIQDQLKIFESTQACPEGATLERFKFQNKRVYVFHPGYCGADLTADVLDESCNQLGFLGGIMGNTIINNEDFISAVSEGVVWSN